MSASGTIPNRLILERSPYLRQHATNPVHWYPWCEEAIEKAKRENKLIFLSVGYSTCHWCHVMEYESFQNTSIAEIMNENFVNIKVDREERPDVDAAYMNFIRLTCGSGGWPLNVFLAPNLYPIGGGTYFPPDDKWGRPGFKSVLLAVIDKWKENSEQVRILSENIADRLRKTSTLEAKIPVTVTKETLPDLNCADDCFEQLHRLYDEEFGGFEFAPKFPQSSVLAFLFHYYSFDKNGRRNKIALSAALNTLQKMSEGGIWDHIGQGFSRYSTDEKWRVPHFEKMLYDQAQLTTAYTTAYLITKNTFFRDVVNGILTYVNRRLTCHEEGGFFSAEDADSLRSNDNDNRKHEGAFYVWKFKELETYLNRPLENNSRLTLADIFCYHYNVRENGNVSPSNDPNGHFAGENVLFVSGDESKTANEFDVSVDEVKRALSSARDILFAEREKRPRPQLDTKIVASWNGLMISAYSKAAQAFKNFSYQTRAVEAASFVRRRLWSKENGKLLRCCYFDETGKNITFSTNVIYGFLDDYAFLIRGLLDLYDCTCDSKWIEWSERLQDAQSDLFWNDTAGIFNAGSESDHFNLLPPTEEGDYSEPSGNSVAVGNLLRLSFLLNRDDFREKAETILSSFTARLSRNAASVPEMVNNAMFYRASAVQIFIVENGNKERAAQMLQLVRNYYLPNRIFVWVENDRSSFLRRKLKIFEYTNSKNDDSPVVYICRNRSCSLPINTLAELEAALTSI